MLTHQQVSLAAVSATLLLVHVLDIDTATAYTAAAGAPALTEVVSPAAAAFT